RTSRAIDLRAVDLRKVESVIRVNATQHVTAATVQKCAHRSTRHGERISSGSYAFFSIAACAEVSHEVRLEHANLPVPFHTWRRMRRRAPQGTRSSEHQRWAGRHP